MELCYYILKENFFLKKNYSFEISKPLLSLQEKLITETKFFQTHHLNTSLYKNLATT